MKIEKIGYNKIKITVTLDDMSEWGLSFDSFVGNTKEAQDLFWNMLRKAENEAGFLIDNSQLMVEAMPLKNEGIVLFVTKVEEEYTDEVERILRAKPRRPRYKVKKLHQDVAAESLIYGFDDFDNLCGFVKALPDSGGESRLYKNDGAYYLSISADPGEAGAEALSAYAGEFGGWRSPADFGEALVGEHAETILKKDAIETIKKYF